MKRVVAVALLAVDLVGCFDFGKPPPSTCQDDSNCLGGMTCLTGKCVANCADKAASCGENESCDDSSGKASCVCKQGYTCGVCIVGEKKSCNPGMCNEQEITCTNGKYSCPPSIKPETEIEFCARLGKNCDVVTAADNNCKTLRSVNCGSCDLSRTCSEHVCECRIPAVRHASNAPLAPPTYQYSGSEPVVYDSTNKLVWQRDVEYQPCRGGKCTFTEAQDYCSNLSRDFFAGCKDWRVPTKTELESLIVTTGSYPHTSTDAFPQMISTLPYYDYFWTSTTCEDINCLKQDGTYTNNPGLAWLVTFRDGIVNWGGNLGSFFVRCVR